MSQQVRKLAFFPAAQQEPKLLLIGQFIHVTSLAFMITWNAFGHVLSLATNTRNKSARFSCLDMGTRSLFVFSTFQSLDYGTSKNNQANPYGCIRENKKRTLSKCVRDRSLFMAGRGSEEYGGHIDFWIY